MAPECLDFNEWWNIWEIMYVQKVYTKPAIKQGEPSKSTTKTPLTTTVYMYIIDWLSKHFALIFKFQSTLLNKADERRTKAAPTQQ